MSLLTQELFVHKIHVTQSSYNPQAEKSPQKVASHRMC